MDNIDNNQPSTCRKADKTFLPHLAAERPSYAFYILGSGEAFSIMTKTCNKCGENKPLAAFNTDKQARDGLTYSCKHCNKLRAAKYYKDNKRAVVKRVTSYIKNKKNKDVSFRTLSNLRGRLNNAIKGLNKSDTTLNLLGCTTGELRHHLESQFTDGMSWSNYGLHGWHIDHIKPCASFDMSDPEQQRECFHYTNLQPLWARDNLAKSDKII